LAPHRASLRRAQICYLQRKANPDAVKGLVPPLDRPPEPAGETCADAHHHHLTCHNCGHSVEVEGLAAERRAEQVAAEAGFTDIGHTAELFAPWPDCGRL
jgi:hypothetical protein